MELKHIVAIACGLNKPKKDYSIISKKNLYLNYGLLGLCTILSNKGYDVSQFQGEYKEPRELIEEINNTAYKLKTIETPIIISIVSFLSLEWCYEITKILKLEYGLKCIVGGKYVVDGNVSWLKAKLPYVDLFIEGAGENKIERAILSDISSFSSEHMDCYSKLDYSLVYNYKLYQPSIEMARGCGRGCSYCADGTRRRSPIKDADSVLNELHSIEEMYDYEDINLYFQMATFEVDERWTEVYERRMREFKKKIQWRCTSRVDVLNKNIIPKLGNIGLKVIDLGLESASLRQLTTMGKTNSPRKYLSNAEEILKVAYENGVWVKLNILLTAGEDFDSIAETKEWLNKNKRYIKGISANCETIYGPNNNLIRTSRYLGSSLVNESDLINKGYSYINLSKEIDYVMATKLAKELSRIVMTSSDYYDLKKFGYFPRNYKKTQFIKDLHGINESDLPFKLEER